MTDAGARFGIQTQKKSALVAQQIVTEIVANRLSGGDRLAPEAEMCATYGVGRSTIREALRLLESQGVVKIKTGPGGGPILTDFEAGFLAANMALHLQLSGATFRDVMNARLVIEPAIAGAAAEHRDDATVHDLRIVVEHSHDPAADRHTLVGQSANFHDIVAAGSGNAFFEYLMLALHRITEPFAQRLPYEAERRERLVDDHEAILAAIAEGNRDAAMVAMRADLLEFLDYAEQEVPQLLDEKIDWGRVSG